MAKLTVQDRVQFSSQKASSVLKWVLVSGSLTFLLLELQTILNSGEVDTKRLITLGLNALINTSIFAVAKYMEGK